MTAREFSYVVLQYRRSPATGEALNVGVVAYAPATGEIAIRWEPSYSRLSSAFEGFNGEQYRATLRHLESSLARLQTQLQENLYAAEQREQFKHAADIVRAIWADSELCYGVSPVRYGLTEDLQAEVDDLFEYFVRTQAPADEERARRSDEAVWRRFEQTLREQNYILAVQSVVLGAKRIPFDYAYPNGKIHVIEPVSLDYAQPATMENRVFRVLGKALSVSDAQEKLGAFLVVVGRPRRTEYLSRYHELVAMLLERRPLPMFEVMEEQEVAERVDEIARKLSLPRGATDDAH